MMDCTYPGCDVPVAVAVDFLDEDGKPTRPTRRYYYCSFHTVQLAVEDAALVECDFDAILELVMPLWLKQQRYKRDRPYAETFAEIEKKALKEEEARK